MNQRRSGLFWYPGIAKQSKSYTQTWDDSNKTLIAGYWSRVLLTRRHYLNALVSGRPSMGTFQGTNRRAQTSIESWRGILSYTLLEWVYDLLAFSVMWICGYPSVGKSTVASHFVNQPIRKSTVHQLQWLYKPDWPLVHRGVQTYL